MKIDDLKNEYVFLGFDIRNTNGHLLLDTLNNKKKIFSVDKEICSRPSNLIDFNWDEVGITQTELGLFLNYFFAKKYFEELGEKDKINYEILAIFLYKPNFQEAVKSEVVNDTLIVDFCDTDFKHLKDFAGYDISTIEYEWISALLNIKPKSGEIIAKNLLNSSCLIDTFAIAQKTAAIAENIIPEHKPFGIWAIWSCNT